MPKISILRYGDIVKALKYIPPADHKETVRLLVVLLDSGADPWTALAALYYHAAARPAGQQFTRSSSNSLTVR